MNSDLPGDSLWSGSLLDPSIVHSGEPPQAGFQWANPVDVDLQPWSLPGIDSTNLEVDVPLDILGQTTNVIPPADDLLKLANRPFLLVEADNLVPSMTEAASHQHELSDAGPPTYQLGLGLAESRSGYGSLSTPAQPISQAPAHRLWATKADWIKHRAKITRLYSTQGMALREVKKVMEEEDNFLATYAIPVFLSPRLVLIVKYRSKMYKDRFKQWGLGKNINEQEANAVLNLKTQRDAIGKSSEFFKYGKKLDYGRILKHLARKGMHLTKWHGAATSRSTMLTTQARFASSPHRHNHTCAPQMQLQNKRSCCAD
jgi:Clr5 domain